jgi:choline dehydrogenase-like flavoprotein
MKIIDANELQATTALNADICIVGAGATSITVASELDGTSHTVCLIESGGYGPWESVRHGWAVLHGSSAGGVWESQIVESSKAAIVARDAPGGWQGTSRH